MFLKHMALASCSRGTFCIWKVIPYLHDCNARYHPFFFFFPLVELWASGIVSHDIRICCFEYSETFFYFHPLIRDKPDDQTSELCKSATFQCCRKDRQDFTEVGMNVQGSRIRTNTQPAAEMRSCTEPVTWTSSTGLLHMPLHWSVASQADSRVSIVNHYLCI